MSGAWVFAGAFLLGSIPFGLLVSRAFFGTDIRAEGSGNIGAANALRTLGAKAGAAVLLLDALKGAAAVLLAARLAPGGPLAALAGLAAVLGHCYTPWLRFRGGKGVATFLGATFALAWPAGVAFLAVWLALVLPTGFASLGSLLGTLAAGIILVGSAGTPGGLRAGIAAYATGSFLIILWKHADNVARLRAGTENRIALLKR